MKKKESNITELWVCNILKIHEIIGNDCTARLLVVNSVGSWAGGICIVIGAPELCWLSIRCQFDRTRPNERLAAINEAMRSHTLIQLAGNSR